MARYVAARAAVLSRSLVNGLVNDLILFGKFLLASSLTSPRSPSSNAATLKRSSGWNRTRTSRRYSPVTSVSPSQQCTAPC